MCDVLPPRLNALNPVPAALQHEDQCCVYQHLNPARPQLSHIMGAPTGVGIKMDRAVYLQWESKVEKHDVGRIDLVPLLHNFGHSGPPSSVRCAQVIAPRPPFAFCAPTPVLNLVPTLRTLKAALLWCRRSVVADGCIRVRLNH